MFYLFDNAGRQISSRATLSGDAEQDKGYMEITEESPTLEFKLVDGSPVAVTEQELEARFNEIQERERQRREKYEGKPYTIDGIEYLVPLTTDAQTFITTVTVAFDKGAIAETKLEFANGTVMPIKAAEWEAFSYWFAVERNKLFI